MTTVSYLDIARLLIHRVLAGHAPFEECDACPLVLCRHCADVGKPGADHTCPCPNGDDCVDHLKGTDR